MAVRFDEKEVKGVSCTRHVYKETEGRKLDLLLALPKTFPAGCAFFIHGGGWRGDGPERLEPHARYAALRGFVGASISYRLLDESTKTDVRDGLADCLDALAFVRSRMREKYGDLPTAAIGDSAGGYYAACLGCQKIIREVRPEIPRADFVVDLNGIVDLTGKWGYGILGKPSDREEKAQIERRFSPLFCVSEGDAPALILHGDKDKTVALSDAVAYGGALTAAGVENRLRVLEGAAHAFILFDYHHDNGYVARVLESVMDALSVRFPSQGPQSEK